MSNKINRNEDGSVNVKQEAYTKRLLKHFDMSQCKPAATPIVQDTLVGKVDIEEKVKSRDFLYRGCVGALITATRPDIAFTLSKASLFL